MNQDVGRKKTILVVDDAPENTKIVKAILVPDYTVKIAADGMIALRIAETLVPDLILLDVVMPNISGYEVCKRLKANPATAGIPVLFLTTLTDRDNENLGMSLGAAGYIISPFQPEHLREQVRSHLERE